MTFSTGPINSDNTALFIHDPWELLDGRQNAFLFPGQFPAMVNGYPTTSPPNKRVRWPVTTDGPQPPWMIAGVDYAVGLPPGWVGIDWSTIDQFTGSHPIPGANVDLTHNSVTLDNGTTLQFVDFTASNGGFLNIAGASNLVITKCLFGWGRNFMSSPHSSIVNLSGNNITFTYNEMNGGGLVFANTITANGNTSIGGTVISIPTMPSWMANGIDICVHNLTTDAYIFNGPNGDNTATVGSFTLSSITVSGTTAISSITSGDSLRISGMAHQTTLVTAQNPSSSVNGSYVFQYNYFHDFNQHVIELSSDNSATFTLTIKYNMSRNGNDGTSGPPGLGPHLNYLQWGHLNVDNPNCIVEFNSYWQSQEFTNGGEGIQGYCNAPPNSSTVTTSSGTLVGGTVINCTPPGWVATGMVINVSDNTSGQTIYTRANVLGVGASTITVDIGAANAITGGDSITISQFTAPGGQYAFNTMIFSPLGSGIPRFGGPLTGKNWLAHDNFIDKQGNASYFAGDTTNPGPTGNTYTNNVDMTNGRVFGLS